MVSNFPFWYFCTFTDSGYECLMPLSSTSHKRPKECIVLAQIKWRKECRVQVELNAISMRPFRHLTPSLNLFIKL